MKFVKYRKGGTDDDLKWAYVPMEEIDDNGKIKKAFWNSIYTDREGFSIEYWLVDKPDKNWLTNRLNLMRDKSAYYATKAHSLLQVYNKYYDDSEDGS